MAFLFARDLPLSAIAADAVTEPAPAVEKETAAAAAAAATAAAASKNTYTDARGRTVYTFAERTPTYAGDESEMNKYLKKKLKHPATDADGTGFVSFVVDEGGVVSDAKVERGAEDISDAQTY